MLNISENSFIYQFQLNAVISEARNLPDHEPGRRIPENLCPYMRRFVRLFIASIALYTVLWLAVLITLAAPLSFFMLMPPVVIGMGSVFWFGILIAIVHEWYVRYGKHNAKLTNAKRKTKRALRKAWRPIGSRIDCNIFVRWYHAVHDKICPALHFTERSQ
jgi:hypothetical protein